MPLPDMPLLFFPRPQTKPIPTKKPIPISAPKHPSIEQQHERLGVRFDRLNTAFESQRVNIADTASGVIPEATLVIYTRGSNADFTKACRIVGFELLGEFDEYDLPEDDGFFVEKKYVNGIVSGKKPVTTGRLFITFSDLTAKDKLLSLWNKWTSHESLHHIKTIPGTRG